MTMILLTSLIMSLSYYVLNSSYFLFQKQFGAVLTGVQVGLIVNGLIESAKLVKQTGRKRSEFFESNEDAGNYLVNLIKFNKEKQELASHGIFTEHFKGTYVTNLYIFFKFLNLLNVLIQIVWLNMFFGYAYTFWGWGILMDLYNGVEWEHSGQFPRVTYCDVQIREIGANIRKKTFQCVLMLNMFNEKIFIFIWFWLFFLLILNSINLGAWIYRSYNLGNIKSFVNKHLGYKSIELEDHELEDFIQNMLFKDITILLRLMEYNCGSLATTEVIFSIYDQYKKEEERKKNINQQ
uniref:Innexin n=1 Tax=Acrobeloides nanus TaxID=290746 RepID=A0A914EPP0_9BILA